MDFVADFMENMNFENGSTFFNTTEHMHSGTVFLDAV